MAEAFDPRLSEQTLQREELLRGHFLHALRDTVQLPDGSQATREYIVHPGAVMVVPILDDGSLVLERQYRHPMAQVMLEFPAGKLDAGGAPWTCGRRELLEETGYTAREWARAGVLHPVIAYSTEFIEVWFARGLELHERRPDAGEFLEVFHASQEQLMAWCRDGQITDAKTLIGALWLQNWRAGTWPLQWQANPDAAPSQAG
jgi:ADP-ribose pyrophosphatase